MCCNGCSQTLSKNPRDEALQYGESENAQLRESVKMDRCFSIWTGGSPGWNCHNDSGHHSVPQFTARILFALCVTGHRDSVLVWRDMFNLGSVADLAPWSEVAPLASDHFLAPELPMLQLLILLAIVCLLIGLFATGVEPKNFLAKRAARCKFGVLSEQENLKWPMRI